MKRSKFSLSHYKLLSCDMGKLVPIGLTEVLPGDTLQQSTSLLVRVSPLLAPVMHPVQVRIHHWFVPHRLVWEDWEDFITGGPDGMDASVLPTKNTAWAIGGLADYLGVPPGSHAVSALPFRGYQKIWNEFYRDQDLEAEAVISEASGLDTTTDHFLKSCAWEKDYFTSARPWTQKGPDVSLPLGVSAPVSGTPSWAVSGAGAYTARNATVESSPGVMRLNPNNGPVDGNISLANPSGLIADLTNATAANINDIRRAFALQRYEEARARYGSRYTEYLRYLGVRSSDARLQRPEYLGGGKQTIQFSEVLKTGAGEDPAEAIGSLKGHGIGAVRSNRYRRFIEEHGYVFTLMSVRPKTIYTQGIHRSLTRSTKEDFFQKELQHIGQQEILNKEVYADHTTPDGIFGYQDRYDEYRRAESGVAGSFRDTLDFWHYARVFAADPVLNASFVSCDPTKRVNAVQDEDVLWVMANHSIQARRMVAPSGSSHIF